MKLELYYAKNCPSCDKVRDFISVKDLGKQITTLEASGDELKEPRLLIDGRPLVGADAIILWIDRNLSPSDSLALTL